ncbi:SlyX family protein [Chromatiaceae bacterium AAb-1]|nr:SlyX family protein [Chromatiaceae bacterium AAb-1]
MTEQDNALQLHIIELENKLAFQEDTILSLGNELLEHQKKIERLQQQLVLIAEKLRQLPDSQILHPEEEPPPPHY